MAGHRLLVASHLYIALINQPMNLLCAESNDRVSLVL